MNDRDHQIKRRNFLKLVAGLAGGYCLHAGTVSAQDRAPIRKAIASSGEQIPVIGMGTSRTFEAAGDQAMIANLARVMQTFFAQGGTVIDSSPMYGSSEQVIGRLLQTVTPGSGLFAATKVWTDGRESGISQMEQSRRLWGIDRFDLIQIHNLRDWKVHYKTLMDMKAEGRIRYIGITTSHGRDHQELLSVLQKHPFDFVQFSYNIGNREVERALLPLAAERGIAVIVNRPFARGSLFGATRGKPLPEWAADFDCASWGQFFRKYAVSHPAVTCAIPATSKVHHMEDNMGAGFGRLPDAPMRKRMESYFESL
jgi:diketogulonate reductase-like aldo/keto reductase